MRHTSYSPAKKCYAFSLKRHHIIIILSLFLCIRHDAYTSTIPDEHKETGIKIPSSIADVVPQTQGIKASEQRTAAPIYHHEDSDDEEDTHNEIIIKSSHINPNAEYGIWGGDYKIDAYRGKEWGDQSSR